MKTAAIAGSTGLVGGFCLDQLLASSDFGKAVSLARRPSGRTHAKLAERAINFDQLPFEVPGCGAETLFCCLGTTIRKAGSREAFRKVDFEYVVAFARWGLENGARHFLVVSAMGADASSRIFYNRTKGEMEAAIGKLGYQTIDVFRPSLLLGPRKETRVGERVAEIALRLFGPTMIAGLRDYRPIQGEDVARAMIRRAQQREPGFHVHLSSKIQTLNLLPWSSTSGG